MKEPHIEGPATHDGPESCATTREGGGEALTEVAPVSWSPPAVRKGFHDAEVTPPIPAGVP